MVKLYYRFSQSDVFGVVASPNCNVVFQGRGQHVVAGALENVVVWDVKREVPTLLGDPKKEGVETTRISRSPDDAHVAVGYGDGSIRVWDVKTKELAQNLAGHVSAISALEYSKSGSILASGSKDTEIVLWDIVGETGLFRLRGHRNQVTDLQFIEYENGPVKRHAGSSRVEGLRLLSCSKDTTVKLWDLESQHCLQTIVGIRGEIASVALSPDAKRLVIGGIADNLRVFSVLSDQEKADQGKADDETIVPVGILARESKERVGMLRFLSSGELLACQNNDRTIEVYGVADDDQIKKRIRRRLRRQREKHRPTDQDDENGTEQLSDVIRPLYVLRADQRVRSFDFIPASSRGTALAKMVVLLNNNAFHIFELQPESPLLLAPIERQGHRADVRFVTLNEDNSLALTCSSDTRLWNVATKSVIRVFDSGYTLCASFLPTSRYVLTATKSGDLCVFSTLNGQLVCREAAHTGPIWALALWPDGLGVTTASADHSVRFFSFDLSGSDPSSPVSLVPTRTLKMSDDALTVRYTANGKLLLVALLDCTVKVFYADSLKFFLSLYGHKLPILCCDTSSDSSLVVTGSADKSVRIWGLDFGDCHKSMFAHDDNVMQVAFVPKTHHFFSAGKDGKVKYWDADSFELIMALDGHHGPVWGLAVSHVKREKFIMTASGDRSIRLWSMTDEQMAIEEEQEKMMEAEQNAEDLRLSRHHQEAPEVPGTEKIVMESASAAAMTAESALGGDRLLEALVENTSKDPARVLTELKRLRATDLEGALLLLPFPAAVTLLECMERWVDEHVDTELLCRTLLFVGRVFQKQIEATPGLRSTLEKVGHGLRNELQSFKTTIGFNQAAISFILRDMASLQTHDLWRGPGNKTTGKEAIVRPVSTRLPRGAVPVEEGRKRRKKGKEAEGKAMEWL